MTKDEEFAAARKQILVAYHTEPKMNAGVKQLAEMMVASLPESMKGNWQLDLDIAKENAISAFAWVMVDWEPEG